MKTISKLSVLAAGLLAVSGNLALAQANTSLSNLVAPTAINASLLFDTNTAYDIGSSSIAGNNIYVQTVNGSTGGLFLQSQSVSSGSASGVSLSGGNTADTGSGNGAGVAILGGTASATGNTGSGGGIYLEAGAGYTTPGNIQLNPGNLGGTSAWGVVLIQSGHLEANGTAPTLGACGTSPNIAGNDIVGRINVGTTTASCAITFSYAWNNAPVCTVNDETARIALKVVPTTTTLTVSAAANYAAGTVLDYHCIGYQ